jgi:hypothetical protein
VESSSKWKKCAEFSGNGTLSKTEIILSILVETRYIM